ncbi:unnamed protein product [Medioppia subpectinata]|uniref:Uncharacterized protein n=1 Tax=Medioppia subpectinata TaxID=1979941 RepID=A0A7R9L1R4_9ACAR|nr:unnamed protein product [Medioppia subpectinata]CAG2112712.1 unnamed protein product [Medioppia subpectinata]
MVKYAFLSENFRKAFHKVIVCNSNARRTLQVRSERIDRETTVGTNTCTTKATKTINGNV